MCHIKVVRLQSSRGVNSPPVFFYLTGTNDMVYKKRMAENKKLTRTTFHITAHQVEALKMHSRQTGLAMADILRRAIDNYMALQTTDIKKR